MPNSCVGTTAPGVSPTLSVWSAGVAPLLLDAGADKDEPARDVPPDVARLLPENTLLAAALEEPAGWDVAAGDEEDTVVEVVPANEEDAAALEFPAEDEGEADVAALLVARVELPEARDDDGPPDVEELLEELLEEALEELLDESWVPVVVHPATAAAAAAAPVTAHAKNHTRISPSQVQNTHGNLARPPKCTRAQALGFVGRRRVQPRPPHPGGRANSLRTGLHWSARKPLVRVGIYDKPHDICRVRQPLWRSPQTMDRLHSPRVRQCPVRWWRP